MSHLRRAHNRISYSKEAGTQLRKEVAQKVQQTYSANLQLLKPKTGRKRIKFQTLTTSSDLWAYLSGKRLWSTVQRKIQ